MDPLAMLAFATMLLEVAKLTANNTPSHEWPDGVLSLANRAADMFDRVIEIQAESRPRFLWTVWLVSEGSRKIDCIKTLREYTHLGLKEAKDKVESHPCALLETEDEDLAWRMYEQLTRDIPYPDQIKPTVELRKGPSLRSVVVSSSCPTLLPSCPDEYPG